MSGQEQPRPAGGMRIRQFVYFGLWSDTLTAAAITQILELSPDATSVRGSLHLDPPRPPHHRWALECRRTELRIDEQIAHVLTRVRPIADRIKPLTLTGDVTAALIIVRYFDDEAGEPERIDTIELPDGQPLTKLSGQHQLLGWHIEPADLQLLALLHADLDVDEYN